MIVSRPRGIARKHRRNDYLHTPLSRHTPSDVRSTSTFYRYPTTHHHHRDSTMGWFGPSRSPYSSGNYYSKSTWGRPASTYSSHSYYKRRPRDGYINRLLYKLKQLLRELYDYARRHPAKLFFMVIMPLLSSGALHGILRQFGISLPRALNTALGGAPMGGGYGARSYSSGYYGSSGYGHDYGRGSEGLNLGSLMSLASLAKHFI